MAVDPTTLSVAELRRRYVEGGEPVTSRLLARLKRDRRQGVQRLLETLRRRHDREREEHLRLDAMLNFERVLWRAGTKRIAGVDEAGVGPLAGPVVAAAVVFPPGSRLDGVDDSKRLDAEQRERLADAIRKTASGIGVGVTDVEEIDRLNIHHAALLAMRRAVEALPEAPEHVLVDARTIPGVRAPQNPFQRGDGLNFSIAAASIIAKTERDRIMLELDARHPGYGFAKHKGYATAAHQAAVRRLGPSAIHRRSYTFLRELCGEYCELFYELQRELARAGCAAELEAFEARLDGCREALAENEHRKLRLTVTRRWKLL